MNVRVLADGLHFAEGPRWHQGTLWFSDFYDHAVKTVDLDGRVETKVEVPGQPSGLGWLPDGRMLVVSMTDRMLARWEYSQLVQHADLSGIAGFHCNDMVVDATGRAYVGNFGFDLFEAMTSADPQPFDTYPTATLAIVEPDGTVNAGPSDLMFPNGSVITDDGRTLVLAETLAARLTAFDIAADGSLSNRRPWAEVEGRAPDGICLDAEGAIWFADALGKECVRVAEGGTVLDAVTTEQTPFACMLGGNDGRTLFMCTAATSSPMLAAAERTGRIDITQVSVPRAGRP
jgi:sugar lactone lactonase YvrE